MFTARATLLQCRQLKVRATGAFVGYYSRSTRHRAAHRRLSNNQRRLSSRALKEGHNSSSNIIPGLHRFTTVLESRGARRHDSAHERLARPTRLSSTARLGLHYSEVVMHHLLYLLLLYHLHRLLTRTLSRTPGPKRCQHRFGGFKHKVRLISMTKRGASKNSSDLGRAPGARSIAAEFFEAPLLVIELQRCENTPFYFHAAPFGTRSPSQVVITASSIRSVRDTVSEALTECARPERPLGALLHPWEFGYCPCRAGSASIGACSTVLRRRNGLRYGGLLRCEPP